MAVVLFSTGPAMHPQMRLGCVLALLSIAGVVVGPKVLSPTQAAAKAAFNAAMPSGKPGKAEPPEKEAIYEELEALFDAVDWSDPEKNVPAFDDGVQLDEAEFAGYVGAHATISESNVGEMFAEIDRGWADYLEGLLIELELTAEHVAAIKAEGYGSIPQLAAVEKLESLLKKAGVKKLATRKSVARAIRESDETHGDGKIDRYEIASWWASKCWRHESCVECKSKAACGWCLKKGRCVPDVPELCAGPGDHVGAYEWSAGECEEDVKAAEAATEFMEALGIGDKEL